MLEPYKSMRGVDIGTTARLLRHYVAVERCCLKVLAGWFCHVPRYEDKYRLAYHAYAHAEHVSLLRRRLVELRGGRPDAAVAPALRHLLDAAVHAPSSSAMLHGLYGVIKRDLLRVYRQHEQRADPSANAVELRLLRHIIPELEEQLAWYDSLDLDGDGDPWIEYLRALLQHAGGLDSSQSPTTAPAPFTGTRFERGKTIYFDERIRIGELTPYEQRQQLDTRQSTIEQFKVFFNELYAAALLASIIYDAFDDNLPWEFFADLTRHFWDEVRHSEFGAIRLKELGEAPSVCNPILFERVEALPVLHRLCYLTRGLEAYFMPRKQRRVREYEQSGDYRSQLFADQDWSDEISHVRYGTTWCDHLLQDDYRTVDDILDEVRVHLEKLTGKPQEAISAPF